MVGAYMFRDNSSLGMQDLLKLAERLGAGQRLLVRVSDYTVSPVDTLLHIKGCTAHFPVNRENLRNICIVDVDGTSGKLLLLDLNGFVGSISCAACCRLRIGR